MKKIFSISQAKKRFKSGFFISDSAKSLCNDEVIIYSNVKNKTEHPKLNDFRMALYLYHFTDNKLKAIIKLNKFFNESLNI